MRELWAGWLAHRELWLLTTVASWSHLVYMVHGPPAHVLLLPGLAVILFLRWPLAAVVGADSRDAVARGIAGVGAAIAMAPALVWSYADGADKALKADARPLVAAAAVGGALVVAGLQRGSVDPAAWGLGRGDLRWWARPVGAALALIAVGVPVAVWLFPEFAEFYPRYKPARTDAVALAQYQVAIGVYMFCWEFFFRGFMLFGVARSVGPAAAIVIQASPFFLLHASKPEPELVSSWFGGLLMGALCWRARSMWPSFLLHWALYSSMEVASFVARQAGHG